MFARTPATAVDPLSPARLAIDLVRRYRLQRGSRLLVVDSRPGELVSCLRAHGLTAFGLYDGPAPPRDPYAKAASDDNAPSIQPAVLHQSLPFVAQSFDGVLLQDSDVYRGLLTGPEACTATANLLASLKPGKPLVYTGSIATAVFRAHLNAFPGTSCEIALCSSGIGGLLRKLLGRGGEQTAVQFTLPGEAISRLEWHRLARQAVIGFQRQPAA
ncbi:MAG: hypothetical protein AB7U20_02040 [Planctomycetaceae bacterium]